MLLPCQKSPARQTKAVQDAGVPHATGHWLASRSCRLTRCLVFPAEITQDISHIIALSCVVQLGEGQEVHCGGHLLCRLPLLQRQGAAGGRHLTSKPLHQLLERLIGGSRDYAAAEVAAGRRSGRCSHHLHYLGAQVLGLQSAAAPASRESSSCDSGSSSSSVLAHVARRCCGCDAPAARLQQHTCSSTTVTAAESPVRLHRHVCQWTSSSASRGTSAQPYHNSNFATPPTLTLLCNVHRSMCQWIPSSASGPASRWWYPSSSSCSWAASCQRCAPGFPSPVSADEPLFEVVAPASVCMAGRCITPAGASRIMTTAAPAPA